MDVAGRTIPTGVGKMAQFDYFCGLHLDHPHGRGENASIHFCSSSLSGPSPRAWGKLWKGVNKMFRKRTIPTGVGKITKTFTLPSMPADHPHGRGENGK